MFGFDRNDVGLIYNFFKLNVRDRYMGTTLGGLWAIAQPLLMLATFTFVFGFVFKAKLPGSETTLAYSIWLISGYGPWIATSEALISSTMSVISSSGLVKNLSFKTEILPIAGALIGLLPLGVSLIFLAILLVVDGNSITWHAIFIPINIIIQFVFIISIGFFLSAINVFVKDLGFALPNMLLIILFATPIFYPIASMPEIVKVVSSYNPFYILAEGYRQPLVYHKIPDLFGTAYVLVLSMVLGYIGLKIFRKLKGYFEAVL